MRCAFLGYAPHQKGYICYDPTTQSFVFLIILYFLKNNIFFPFYAAPNHTINVTPHSLLPVFEDETSLFHINPPVPITRFRPGVVYARQNRDTECSTGPPHESPLPLVPNIESPPL